MLSNTRFVALAIAAVVGLSTPTPVFAVDAEPSTRIAGTLLPQHFQAAPTSLRLSASADYVAVPVGRPDQFLEPTYAFYRVADGSLAREVPRSAMADEDGRPLAPSVIGSSFVLTAADVAAPWVEVRDIVTGERIRRWDLTANDKVLTAGADWVFVLRSVADTNNFLLFGADGSSRTVAIPSMAQDYATVLDVDDRSILVQYDDLHVVDLADASTRVVLDGYARIAALTDSRLYWTDSWGNSVSWRSRTGTGEVETAPFNGSHDIAALSRWGTDDVVLTRRTDNTYDPFSLAAIDVANHELVDLSGPISGTAALSNGTVLVGLTDTATGRVVQFAPGHAARTVIELPAVPAHSGPVDFSGNWLSTWTEKNGVEFAPADGTGAWSSAQEVRRVIGTFTNSTFQSSGDVLLGRTADYMGYKLTWPGGGRTLTSYDQLTLGRGGQLLVVEPNSGDLEVQDARTGTVLSTYRNTYGRNVVADGTIVWSVENHQLRAHDTSGATADRLISTPSCFYLHDVIGRWALMRCSSSDAWTVLDLRGIAAPWTVPVSSGFSADSNSAPMLGNGFVAWLNRQVLFGDRTLTVADLAAEHTLATYGPVWADEDWYESFPVTVDDAGSKRLVYLDSARQIRRVDLTWLQEVSLTRADKTKPSLSATSGSARIVKAGATKTRISAGATYTDKDSEVEPASGLKSYDARYQTVPRGTAVGTKWTEPTAWKNLTSASVTLDVAAGTDTCVQFRARDNAGNTSAWSTSRCTELDGTGPKVTSASAGSRVQSIEAKATVKFTYVATDTAGVASYEVAYKAAVDGKNYGSWITPSSWKKRTSTSVPKEIPLGGDTCFRVRATDKVGNVGAWSSEKCTAVAYGETDFKAIGATKDDREKLVFDYDTRALDDRVAVMVKAGGELQKSNVTARQIGVWVIRGSSTGKLDVYIGKTKLARLSTSGSRQKVLLLTPKSSKSLTGTLRIVSVDGKNTKVDAVAVLR